MSESSRRTTVSWAKSEVNDSESVLDPKTMNPDPVFHQSLAADFISGENNLVNLRKLLAKHFCSNPTPSRDQQYQKTPVQLSFVLQL